MIPDFRERLAVLISARRFDAFRWGDRDCVALANDWVRIASKREIFTAKHATAAEAAREISKWGGLEKAVDAHIGTGISDWRKVKHGDVVLFDSDRGEALGVCIGAEFVAQGKDGLIAYPIMAVKRCWNA